ncbi:helix-turn-helix domain-containing protein [Providencia sp. PROV188]|jgi:transcriptional regulator with XRE-family HTH domain|uniref:helix-turn-helix domain-containing protein n=1 Tax=Providencia TaxID=586 RepID=UPI0003E249F5|nr:MULTISPECIES: helix-turn-helix transcriptional regulator [Providencia]ETT03133.1 DNA-binding helix-turn-helix protein [Providencia alcalifaciens PAL-3]EUC98156.1 DNA-binding helix-turn-helix protein [Providencia alcalifaciens PAL-1]MBG5883541.1 helix-turn-helix transcriptional regulator [Providencia alcalifaciens]MDR2241671.1 helix-turn-helix domain-containing protein [Providencia alcalifaciens]MTB46735.1 helix-turn-helix domain-containing protein [Providencia sp. wls1950]
MEKIVSKSVGLKIRALRDSHGISGKQLSEQLGISQQHLSRYENGDVNIHVDTLYHFSLIFSVDPAYFFAEFNEITSSREEQDHKKSYYAAESVVF